MRDGEDISQGGEMTMNAKEAAKRMFCVLFNKDSCLQDDEFSYEDLCQMKAMEICVQQAIDEAVASSELLNAAQKMRDDCERWGYPTARTKAEFRGAVERAEKPAPPCEHKRLAMHNVGDATAKCKACGEDVNLYDGMAKKVEESVMARLEAFQSYAPAPPAPDDEARRVAVTIMQVGSKEWGRKDESMFIKDATALVRAYGDRRAAAALSDDYIVDKLVKERDALKAEVERLTAEIAECIKAVPARFRDVIRESNGEQNSPSTMVVSVHKTAKEIERLTEQVADLEHYKRSLRLKMDYATRLDSVPEIRAFLQAALGGKEDK